MRRSESRSYRLNTSTRPTRRTVKAWRRGWVWTFARWRARSLSRRIESSTEHLCGKFRLSFESGWSERVLAPFFALLPFSSGIGAMLFLYNGNPMATLSFFGAAGTVTGSKYLIQANGKRLLLDCGIFQGSSELSDRNYNPLPVDAKTIDYVVLTHAHLDHTGWLPVLVKSGFKGPIFANASTIELTTLLLKDSGHLQEEDALHERKHRDDPRAERLPLYTSEDVDPVLKLMKPVPRKGAFEVSPEFRFVACDAGHILGSTSLELTIDENGKKTVIVFSGDIGRYGEAILNDPATPHSQVDVLLCESTYGDRD